MLRDLRLSAPDAITSAMLMVSSPAFYVAIPIAIASFFLWCVDRRKGDWILMNIVSGMFFGHLLKYIIQNPRPFVTDDRLIPEEKAMKGTPGYSTPSGHTVDATTSFGSIAVLVRRRSVTLLMIAIIALVMFSRLYLGVHTEWDLLVGVLTAITVMIINSALISYSYKNDGNYFRITVVYLLLFIIGTTVWMLVTDHHGDLMKYGGLMLGAIIGRQIGHGIKDDAPCHRFGNIAGRLAIGWIITALLFAIPVLLFGTNVGYLIGGFLCSMNIFALSPALFRSLNI